MGVHGLTTWISNRNTLGTPAVFPNALDGGSPVPLIVDALAFLYHTGLDNSLQGGDHQEYRAILRRHVEFWRFVGLEPQFVWDGPFEAGKLSTALQRSDQRLGRGIAYWRRSEAERGRFWVQKKAERLPVLIRMVVLSELRSLGVKIHFAEGEADACTAELAERLSGFAASNDSDYFIFHASGRGYAPLTSFEYGPDLKPFPSQTSSPPPSLHFKVYAPAATARLLAIPPRFLPIFAALVGNDQADYSPELSLVSPRYPGQMDGVAIDRIALAMSRAASLPARTPLEIEGVLAAVVPTLLSRPSSDPHIIANLVRSALSYQLLRVEAPSPTFPLHPSPHDTRAQATSRAAYLQAFRQGSISSVILIFLKHGLVDPPLPIDNPDFSSPSVVLGKSIREVVYAILAHDLYLPRTEVVEHNRRQDHLHVTKVPIPSLVALLSARSPPLNIPLPPSLISSPLPTRLSLYLAVLSTPPALRTLTLAPHRPLLLALHHIHLHSPRPWPTHALLSAFLTSLLLLSPSLPLLPPPSSPPNKHALQLTAELLTTMFHCEVLREALGLVGSGRSGDECYEGRVFHALLGMGDGVERVGEALEEGRREVLGEMMAAFGR